MSGPGRPPAQLFPEAPGHEARLVAAQAMGVDQELAPVDTNHDRGVAAPEGVHDRVGREARDRRVDREEQGWRGPHGAVLLEAGPESASFEVVCGKGTYVRALVRDLAERLGVLGYVASLRRLKVGPFDEKHAISLDKLGALVHSGGPEATLLPVEAGLVDIPALRLTQPQAERLRHGQAVRVNPAPEGTVYAMAAGRPVALAEVAAGEARALRVFNL